MGSKKLQWERGDGGFDLICLNSDTLDKKMAEKLLQKIKAVYDDFKKPFSDKASELWKNWVKNPKQPLPEAAYCLLSNWFLTGSRAANISIRAGIALLLWHKLFCAIPGSRLSDPKRNGKVIPQKFELWWENQQKCQDDC